jgi:Protein of unknown function (DUF3617)
MRFFLVVAVLAGCSGIVFAQAAPVKMGLWEKKMTMDTGTGAPRIMTSRSCVTPAVWQEMTGNVSKPREGCTVHNVKTAHGYTFTATCKTSDGGTMVTTGSQTIPDAEHILSESHTTMNARGQKREMVSKSTSTYQGADCGKVKPGDAETEN